MNDGYGPRSRGYCEFAVNAPIVHNFRFRIVVHLHSESHTTTKVLSPESSILLPGTVAMMDASMTFPSLSHLQISPSAIPHTAIANTTSDERHLQRRGL